MSVIHRVPVQRTSVQHCPVGYTPMEHTCRETEDSRVASVAMFYTIRLNHHAPL